MQMTQAQDLELKTKTYWLLSHIWNGRHQADVSTGEAIELCTIVLNWTSYFRPLSHCVDSLLQEIIKGEGNARAQVTKIIPFAKRS